MRKPKAVLKIIGPIAAALVLATPIQADQQDSKWNVGARLSTIGIQGEITYRFNKTFALRLQAGGYNHYQKELEFEKKKYHHIRFRPIVTTLYADYYFLTDWWRVSGGISYNHTKIHAREKIVFGQMSLGVAALTYRYKNKITPYLGTGLDIKFPCGSKFIFTVDAGINFMGEVKANPKISGLAGLSPIAVPTAKKKGEKRLNNLWWVKNYPTISVGVKYEL